MATSASDKAADRWQTSQPQGYNPNAYYTKASDTKGHSAKITVKVPVNVAGEISAAVQSGKIDGYKTVQDFVRDAVIHRLHFIEPILEDPDLKRKITMWTIHQDALRSKQQREEYADMMVAIVEHVSHLLSTRQDKKLRIYLVDLLDKAELAIPSQFLKEFQDDIRARLKATPRPETE